MSPLLPPVCRGKIPTTSGRLLLAAAAMFVLDLLLFYESGMGVFFVNFWQVVILIVVLLLSPRRWVALVLMLPACFFFLPITPAPELWQRLWDDAAAILPLLLGVLVAYPRPRRRVVYVEEDEA